ncbi:hypothetical protein INR49_012077 [Caranx melampygus]|nr:hypothetical protein INR49_012077 [Caranx melampygus]
MFDGVHPLESVYNHLPKEVVHPEKPPRYISKFRPTVSLESKSNKDAMRTMGPAKVKLPSPDKYLKKHAKEPKLPEKARCSAEGPHIYTVKTADPVDPADSADPADPAVPASTDDPPITHTKGDLIEKTTLAPKTPQPTFVDTNKGHRQPLENSGLVPKYIKKKDYGQVPKYILQRHEIAQRFQEEYDKYVKEKEQEANTQLSDEEHQVLLKGLKKTWDDLHHEYQGLPLIIDTMRAKNYKHWLEGAMKQLEQDINLFERMSPNVSSFQGLHLVNVYIFQFARRSSQAS